MVSQPKIFRVFGAALGLYNVLGAQGHWIGPMGEPGDLARRQAASITCSAGSVPCGNSGCQDESRCCNQDTGWYCAAGDACYTVSGTVDCYVGGGVVPTTARSCHNYAESNCDSGDGCYRCVSTNAPYCYTEVLYGASEYWLNCYSIAGVTTTVGPGPQVSTIMTTTPAPSGSSSTTSASYTAPVASSGVFSPTITPTPTTSSPTSTPTVSNPRPISGGAIAGITIGGFAAIAIIGVLAFLLWKKSQNKQQPQHPQQPQMVEPVQYQPPLTPAPGLPQYQPVAGQPVGLHNSYQEQPKGGYYPPQSPYGGQPEGAYGQAGGAYGQAVEMPLRAEMQGSSEMYTQGGPVELS